MNHPIYITTSIPYVNGAPHVGHAQELILTDTLARLYRLTGHKVTLQTGTDENAFKNVESARAAGVDPLAFVTANAERFRALADRLHVSYDSFIRTTEPRHAQGVQRFWRALKSEDLYEKSYSGRYCQGCEDFLLDKDLQNGLCPDHKVAPRTVEEENIFFRLSRYQADLEQLILSDRLRITPTFRKNEVLSFVRQGLSDISLTRDAARSDGWGIPVPGRKDQVVYVWIDALINYISGQGYGGSAEAWKNVWNSDVYKIHVIGKNVWKFHAVYWPALLLSAGLPLPDEIVVHGFLTVNGEKISKSLGNTIDPTQVVEAWGDDVLRHYSLTYLSTFQDSDFSSEQIANVYTSDFANTLGNLISRLAALARKASVSLALNHDTPTVDFSSHRDLQSLNKDAWAAVSRINAKINAVRPWEHLKDGPSPDVEKHLRDWVNRLAAACLLFSCAWPEGGGKLLRLLNRGIEHQIEPLFPRR